MRPLGFPAFLATALLLGCGPAHEHDDHVHLPDGSHPDAHSHEPIAVTRYTDSLELYLEYEPMILGNTTRLFAHFTQLGQRHRPVEDGSLTVSLEMRGSTVTARSKAPHEAGIFIAELIPTMAGEGRMLFTLTVDGREERFAIDTITVHTTPHEAASVHGEALPSGSLTFLKEQQWRVGFATLQLAPSTFHEVLQVGGTVRAAPGNEHIVNAPVSGVVQFFGTGPVEGMQVTKGSTLMVITSGGMAHENMDSEYLKAKAAWEQAAADMRRADLLITDRIISEKEYAEIKNRYRTAEVTFNTLGRDRTEEGRKIMAPGEGHLRDIRVTHGQFVAAGTPLLTVARSGRLHMVALVPQREAQRLRGIGSATFRVASDTRVHDSVQLNGKLLSFGQSTSGGMVPITFEVDNPGNILPGSFAEVWLRGKPIEEALVIPVDALIEEQGHYAVYVQTGGETMEKRSVTLGGSDGVMVQLLNGVRAGERVVTTGAFQVKLATMGGTMPDHGHEH